MNVYGMKRRPRLDVETGVEMIQPDGDTGMIRYWRHVDRSRQGQPSAHRCVLSFRADLVPGRTADRFHSLIDTGGAPLAMDPRLDAWSAPEWIEFLDMVVAVNPENGDLARIQSFRPRPESWSPEIVVT